MCKEKVAKPKLRKRQPTSDVEATSEFSKCITAVRIEVLFIYPVLRGKGGVYGQVSASGKQSAAVRLKLSTNTEFFHNTQGWNYLVELGLFMYHVFKSIKRK